MWLCGTFDCFVLIVCIRGNVFVVQHQSIQYIVCLARQVKGAENFLLLLQKSICHR